MFTACQRAALFRQVLDSQLVSEWAGAGHDHLGHGRDP
jgi:hypothetical protein